MTGQSMRILENLPRSLSRLRGLWRASKCGRLGRNASLSRLALGAMVRRSLALQNLRYLRHRSWELLLWTTTKHGLLRLMWLLRSLQNLRLIEGDRLLLELRVLLWRISRRITSLKAWRACLMLVIPSPGSRQRTSDALHSPCMPE